MKKKNLAIILIIGLLLFNGCGGSSSRNTSYTNYAKDGFSYENLRGKNFFGLAKEKDLWVTSIIKFFLYENKVYNKEGEAEATNENFTINKSIYGCQKGCIDIVLKNKEDNSVTNLFLKPLLQDEEKITILATIKPEDLSLEKPKNTIFFFFDKENLDNYKKQNSSKSLQ